MALSPREIVVIGGGIIGCSTAYYLTRHPAYDPAVHKITLLEASGIAGGASGKAGGLLALWAYPSCIVPLSYKLHAELAREHDGASQWGYREVHSGQLNARARARLASDNKAKENGELTSLNKRSTKAMDQLKNKNVPQDLDWFVPENLIHYQEMGDPTNTAQVHPYQFTNAMARLAADAGVQIKTHCRVTSIYEADGRVTSVTYIDKQQQSETPLTINATDVVLTAGPWTRSIRPNVPIAGMRAHSVTIKPTRPVSPYVLFTEVRMPDKGGRRQQQVSPEIYARPGQEVYACGEGDRLVPLPQTTSEVEVDETYCQAIIDQVGAISDELRDGQVTARQACYLPNVEGAMAGPLVGHGDSHGLFIGAGHTCWGIQNGPGTGKLLSEFVFDGRAKSAKADSLDPRIVL